MRYEVKIQPIKLSRYKYYTCLYFRPYTYYTYCLSFECTRHIAFVIFFFQSLALVVLLLTLYKSYDYLCQPFFIDEHTNRNYGKAGVFRTTLQLVQFFLCQQQFALPTCIMIIVRNRKNIRQYAYSSPIARHWRSSKTYLPDLPFPNG